MTTINKLKSLVIRIEKYSETKRFQNSGHYDSETGETVITDIAADKKIDTLMLKAQNEISKEIERTEKLINELTEKKRKLDELLSIAESYHYATFASRYIKEWEI